MKFVFALFGLASSAALAQPLDPAVVTKLLGDPNSLEEPGCVAGAFRNGEPLFIGGAGAANLEQKRSLDGDSLFYTASVSKQFTALAAAKLIEQGRLSLDDDIRKYLPELSAYDAPVTVGMLMHHTSGVRDWIALRALSGGSPPAKDRVEALDLLLRQKDTNFTPGSRWAYSNGGYLLLSEIVARVAGMPFEAYASEAILRPLGMESSLFLNGALPNSSNLVSGYAPAGDRFELRDGSPLFSGSGGLMTTMNDLANYERDWAKGAKVWTPKVREIMLTPARLNSGEPAVAKSGMGYGGGLDIGSRFGENFVQHGGSSDGVRMVYMRMPDRKLTVVVNCNRVDVGVGDKAREIIELIEGDILATSSKPGNPAKGPAAASSAAKAAQVSTPAPVLPANATGRYISDELPAIYQLSQKDGQLEVMIFSPLAPATGKTFGGFKGLPDGTFRSAFLHFKFDPDGSGFLLSAGDVVRDIRFDRAP